MQRYNISRAIPNIEARDVQKYVNDTFPHRKRHLQPRQMYCLRFTNNTRYSVTCDFVTLSTPQRPSNETPTTIYKLYNI